jgi:hypothetical protein
MPRKVLKILQDFRELVLTQLKEGKRLAGARTRFRQPACSNGLQRQSDKTKNSFFGE